MTTHLVIPDPHAHPDFNNDRALLIGKLMSDLKPDVVVNLGDMWDFPSLSSYDKGKKSFWGKTYEADLNAGLDFDEKLWHKVRKSKKKKPRGVFLMGNHEHRLNRVLDLQPELEGTIGLSDFQLDKNYSDIVEYTGSTPGVIGIDNIHYAHFFISGVMGRPVGGENPAHALLAKHYSSCTCGHSHLLDFAIRTLVSGRRIMGCVAGVAQDYQAPWAGEMNKLWWRGVVIKRNVEDGCYDPEFVSLDRLRKEYGQP